MDEALVWCCVVSCGVVRCCVLMGMTVHRVQNDTMYASGVGFSQKLHYNHIRCWECIAVKGAQECMIV